MTDLRGSLMRLGHHNYIYIILSKVSHELLLVITRLSNIT